MKQTPMLVVLDSAAYAGGVGWRHHLAVHAKVLLMTLTPLALACNTLRCC